MSKPTITPQSKNSSPPLTAVVFSEPRVAAGLRDRMRGTRRVRGAGFETLMGRLPSDPMSIEVVAVIPEAGREPDYNQLIAAVWAAHRPERILGAGLVPTTEELPAWSRVVSAETPSLEAGLAKVRSINLEQLNRDWRHEIAAACSRCQPRFALLAVSEPPQEARDSAEQRHLGRQRSTAGKAGAFLRMLARRPTDLPAVWRRQEALWEGQERLADLVVDALRLLNVSSDAATTL